MSQNALLDRETVVRTDEGAPRGATAELPMRITRDHLTLIGWDGTETAALIPVRPARRPWFGPYEISIAVLMLGSIAAGAACLLNLG